MVWFTAAQGTPRVVLARSSRRDVPFDIVTIETVGMIGRPDVALLGDGSCLVLFVVQVSDFAELVAARILENGEEDSRTTVATLKGSRSDGFPRVVSHEGSSAVVTWTDAEGRGRVRVAIIEAVSPDNR